MNNTKSLVYTIIICLFLIGCSSSPKSTDENTENCAISEENIEDISVENADTDNGMFAVISKQTMMLALYDKNCNQIKKYPMACGKGYGDKMKEGDMKTPEGIFKVVAVQDASSWDHDFKDGKGVIKGAYGSRFIRLSTPPHTGIGIHGTHDPASIGTRASEGCIRLKNEDIADFATYAYKGMPIIIIPSDKDMEATVKSGNQRTTEDITVKGKITDNSKQSATPKKSATEEKSAQQSPVKKDEKARNTTLQTHKVKSGENVGKIALKYGMTADELRKLNNIKDDKIKIGQELKVSKK